MAVLGLNLSGAVATKAMIHGSLMFVGWGLLIATGVLVGRFASHETWWFKAHYTIQATASLVIFGSAAFIISIIPSMYQLDSAHKIVGLSLVCLLLIQAIMGFIAHARYDASRVRIPWIPDRLHRNLGKFLLAGAMVNIGLGLFQIGAPFYFYIIYVCFLLSLVSVYAYAEVRRFKNDSHIFEAMTQWPENFEANNRLGDGEDLAVQRAEISEGQTRHYAIVAEPGLINVLMQIATKREKPPVSAQRWLNVLEQEDILSLSDLRLAVQQRDLFMRIKLPLMVLLALEAYLTEGMDSLYRFSARPTVSGESSAMGMSGSPLHSNVHFQTFVASGTAATSELNDGSAVMAAPISDVNVVSARPMTINGTVYELETRSGRMANPDDAEDAPLIRSITPGYSHAANGDDPMVHVASHVEDIFDRRLPSIFIQFDGVVKMINVAFGISADDFDYGVKLTFPAVIGRVIGVIERKKSGKAIVIPTACISQHPTSLGRFVPHLVALDASTAPLDLERERMPIVDLASNRVRYAEVAFCS